MTIIPASLTATVVALSDAGDDAGHIGAFMDESSTKFGGHAALLRDIKINDLKAYHNFSRMCPDDYDELLHSSPARIQTVETPSRLTSELNVPRVAETCHPHCRNIIALSFDTPHDMQQKHATRHGIRRQCGPFRIQRQL